MTRVTVELVPRQRCEWCGQQLPERHKVTMRFCSSTCRAQKAKWRKASTTFWARIAGQRLRGFAHRYHHNTEDNTTP